MSGGIIEGKPIIQSLSSEIGGSGALLSGFEKSQAAHGIAFAVSRPELRVVEESAARHQRIAQFHAMALAVGPEEIARDPAGFVIDRRAQQGRKQRVEQAVFAGFRAPPKFGNRYRRTKQNLFRIGQAAPSRQNFGVSRP